MMPHWLMWTIGAVIFMVVELITTAFFAFWFGVGALVVAILSLFSDSVPFQWIVFLVVSTILLFISRKFFHGITKDVAEKSGFERLIGRTGVVTEEIDEINNTGLVRVEGDEWRAQTTDHGRITKDSYVTVESVSGNRLIVVRNPEHP